MAPKRILLGAFGGGRGGDSDPSRSTRLDAIASATGLSSTPFAACTESQGAFATAETATV